MPLSATLLHRLPTGFEGSYISATVVPMLAAAALGPAPPAIPEALQIGGQMYLLQPSQQDDDLCGE